MQVGQDGESSLGGDLGGGAQAQELPSSGISSRLDPQSRWKVWDVKNAQERTDSGSGPTQKPAGDQGRRKGTEAVKGRRPRRRVALGWCRAAWLLSALLSQREGACWQLCWGTRGTSISRMMDVTHRVPTCWRTWRKCSNGFAYPSPSTRIHLM